MGDPALVSLHVPAGFSTARVVYMTYGAPATLEQQDEKRIEEGLGVSIDNSANSGHESSFSSM